MGDDPLLPDRLAQACRATAERAVWLERLLASAERRPPPAGVGTRKNVRRRAGCRDVRVWRYSC